MPRTAGMDLHINGAPESTARLIYLGVPTFGRVSIRWHAHMMQLQSPLNRSVYHGYAMGWEVGQARNYLVDQALGMVNGNGHTVSHVFFVDDDVLVPPDALVSLLAHNAPIVSGLYYAKTDAPQPLVLKDAYSGVMHPLPAKTVVDCYAHGMGCTLIQIDVFRRMLAEGLVERETLPSGQVLPQFFKTTRDEHSRDAATGANVVKYQTEDVFFLNKARELGYTAKVDTGVFCWHWDEGRKMAYPLKHPFEVAA